MVPFLPIQLYNVTFEHRHENKSPMDQQNHLTHAAQLLFSCLCSKVTLSRALSHTLSISHSHILSFTLSRHAEQLLFSCLGSKVTLSLSHSLTLTLSHSHTLSISHSITLDKLNKFCFHLYAENSVFIAENSNAFFDIITLSCQFGCHRAGSQIKIVLS